jgi:membrane fusion protein, multidrug efflux system
MSQNQTPASAPPTPSREVLHHGPVRWLRPAAFAGAALAAVVIGAGLLSRGLASQSLKRWTAAEAIPTVAVIHPSLTGAAQNLVLPGQIQAFYDAPLHARVNGYLKAWYTDIGARVRAGQVLAIIDTPELDQELAQARAALATAEANEQLAAATAKRWNALLAQDAVSRQETEDRNGDLAAKTTLVTAAQANVQRLMALESFKRITAPFAGVVTARTTDIGQLISADGAPGAPGLFTVADTHRLRIYVSVPQVYTSQVRVGQSLSLTVPEYPGRTFQAAVVSLSGAVGAQSGAQLVEAQTDNQDDALKPGDYAQVSFDLPSQAGALRLPASALMFQHGGMAVAVVGADSRVTLKPVTVGTDLGTTVELSTGVSPADRVVDNPPDSLATGERVRIAAPAKG